MSEEKLYAVKNDKGKYWDFNNAGFWRRETPGYYATTSKKRAEIVAKEHGGHIVTLVEEPEKVVLNREQAEIVEEAHGFYLPAILISQKTGNEGEEELLMKAYVNGYTVAQEKKYNVKVFNSFEGFLYVYKDYVMLSARVDDSRGQFTKTEIAQLKQRDDIPLDWDKVKLEEVLNND